MILLVLLVAAVAPIIPDPFYHKRRISLLLYLSREIEEWYTGERDKRPRSPVLFMFTDSEIGR